MDKYEKLAEVKLKRTALDFLQYNVETLYSKLKEKALGNPFLDVVMDRHLVSLEGALNHHNTAQVYTSDDEESAEPVENISEYDNSLKAHLLKQVHLFRDTTIRETMLVIVDNLDKSGYLTKSLTDIEALSQSDHYAVLDALTLVQQLEPAGVGARNLQECLLLQVERDTGAPKNTDKILSKAFEALVKHDWQYIATQLQMSDEDVQTCVRYISHLNPYPGIAFGSQSVAYSRADVIYDQTVHFNNDLYPKLIFNEGYYTELLASQDADVNVYVAEKYAEYQQLKDFLQYRQETILAVAKAIVNHQAEYFNAHQRIKPLSVATIAHECQLHESVVSRVINGKYIRSQYGITPLRSLFPGGTE